MYSVRLLFFHMDRLSHKIAHISISDLIAFHLLGPFKADSLAGIGFFIFLVLAGMSNSVVA